MSTAKQTRQISLQDDEVLSSPLRLEMTGDSSEVHVVLGARARGVIFDVSTSASHSIRIEMGAESSLQYVSLSTSSVRQCRSFLQAGANIHWHCTTIGSSSKPHTLISELQGKHAVSNVDWIFSLSGKEKQHVSVRNVFAAESGGGEITLKGVAEGTAHAGCDGMIEITEQGGGTNTYLTEDVLMLDPTAKIDAIPGLEIRTNDVKASHSATVSRVTPEDLFYFRSRGITPDIARDMYIEGFLGDLTERISEEDIRLEVCSALKRTAN